MQISFVIGVVQLFMTAVCSASKEPGEPSYSSSIMILPPIAKAEIAANTKMTNDRVSDFQKKRQQQRAELQMFKRKICALEEDAVAEQSRRISLPEMKIPVLAANAGVAQPGGSKSCPSYLAAAQATDARYGMKSAFSVIDESNGTPRSFRSSLMLESTRTLPQDFDKVFDSPPGNNGQETSKDTISPDLMQSEAQLSDEAAASNASSLLGSSGLFNSIGSVEALDGVAASILPTSADASTQTVLHIQPNGDSNTIVMKINVNVHMSRRGRANRHSADENSIC